jgi:acetylornithine deacetylase/succinyl-diaminopimelate desuccinylase-like protein
MHAAAFTFIIELQGVTRHMSKREEAVDAIVAACDLIPRLNAMKFSDAPDDDHRAINRVHVGVMRGALGREFHEWRPPQVADVVRLKGSGRYGPGQTEASALADFRRVLDALEQRFPGLKATVQAEDVKGRQLMPAFRVDRGARIVKDRQRRLSQGPRHRPADRRHHAAGLLRHRCRALLQGAGRRGHRVRSGRPLQHDAGRARRHRRLPRHGAHLHARHARHLRALLNARGARPVSRPARVQRSSTA